MKSILTPLIILPILLAATGLVLAIAYEPSPNIPADNRVWPDSLWSRSSYAERGIDSLPILELVDSLENGAFGAINSLLIVKDGYLVTEEYFGVQDPTTVRITYGITQSVLSALVGIAIEQEELPDPSTEIFRLLPGYGHIFAMDSMKASITLEDLLTMRSGLYWIEYDYPTGHSDYDSLQAVSDPVGMVLARPVRNTPGNIFNYSSGSAVVTSAILEHATEMPLQEYAGRNLFQPLGISNTSWVTLQGVSDGGYGLAATPSDIARFGLLYARNGIWRGKRIVPSDWCRRSTKGSIVVEHAEVFSVLYGYHWWMMRGVTPKMEQVFPGGIVTAMGNGNQILFIAPDHDLVIVMTASQIGLEPMEETPLGHIFTNILPAIFPDLYESSEDQEPAEEQENESEQEYEEEEESPADSVETTSPAMTLRTIHGMTYLM